MKKSYKIILFIIVFLIILVCVANILHLIFYLVVKINWDYTLIKF